MPMQHDPNSPRFVSRSHPRPLLCQKPPAPTEARTPEKTTPSVCLHLHCITSTNCHLLITHIMVHTSGRSLLSYQKPHQHPKTQSNLGQIRGHTITRIPVHNLGNNSLMDQWSFRQSDILPPV